MVLAVPDVPDATHHLTGVHADTQSKLNAPALAYLCTYFLDGRLHAQSASYRSLRIILVYHRNTKQRQYGVAGVILDAAAKALYFLAHASKVHPLHLTHVLRVQLLRLGDKLSQVAEEDGHQTTLKLANRRWWF